MNPYEVRPPQCDPREELRRERKRREGSKNNALEVARLGLVIAVCLIFSAVATGFENHSVAMSLTRIAIGVLIGAVGMAIAYPWYMPQRRRLNELNELLRDDDAAEEFRLAAERSLDDPDQDLESEGQALDGTSSQKNTHQ